MKMKSSMKKYFSIILSVLLFFTLCSCDLNSTYDELDTTSTPYLGQVTKSITTSTPILIIDIQPSAEKPKEIPSTSAPSNFVGEVGAKPVDPHNLPEYTGIPYTIVNDNQPNFSSDELTTTAYERYSNLDSLGRCGKAIASCGREIMPGINEERGSISNIKPSGWKQASYKGISGGYLWNRCHLIGWQLSAENANRQNLITGTRYMNVDGMLTFENMIADYIKETNNHVAYRVTPIFIGNNLVCSGVQMEAYSIEDGGDGICFNVYCYNVQPNITINYATGESNGPKEETASPTVAPTPKPTVKPPTPTPDNGVSGPNGNFVWIPKSGTKYHSYAGCSGMKNPTQVTKQEAINRGYGACKKCW